MYRRDIPEQRKEQLINAAFETINVVGLAGVTLSQVAKEAGLSTGIVSHYFGDKEGLLSATMRKILRDLRDAVAECRAQAASDSQSQLFAIIGATSTPAKPTPCPCARLDFWAASMHQPVLRRLQRANDRRLYSNICCQFRRELPLRQARDAARGLAAMIDGLWLRGGGRRRDRPEAGLPHRLRLRCTAAQCRAAAGVNALVSAILLFAVLGLPHRGVAAVRGQQRLVPPRSTISPPPAR